MTGRDVGRALAAKRVTIKVGSALLVERGKVRREWLDSLAGDIADLRHRGHKVIVVTSGAIALGRPALGLNKRALRLEEKQAAAAAGQIVLARAWQESLARHEIATAQLLITPDDTEGRRRYLNARATMETLLRLGAVPVVNENDTVATSEIRFGDNDRLGARVAVMASSETLVLLSDVDGLYTDNPSTNPDAVHVPVVGNITADIEAMAGESLSGVGSGGMVSKIAAAKIATRAGTTVLLAKGAEMNPVEKLAAGGRCTLFRAQVTPRRARKDWIGASLAVTGSLTIDDGAAGALARGSSLLPAGVVAVDGRFERGDAVFIVTRDGRQLAKGLSAYDAEDARRIAGCKTGDIEALLGWRGRDEMIHRDDLVLL
ncbi:MAG: glutamate 5-kinase [Geminicoccaceae bacterium]